MRNFALFMQNIAELNGSQTRIGVSSAEFNVKRISTSYIYIKQFG